MSINNITQVVIITGTGKGQRELKRIEKLLTDYRVREKLSFKSCDLSKAINKTPHSVWVFLREFENTLMECKKINDKNIEETINFTLIKTNSNRGAVWNIVDIPENRLDEFKNNMESFKFDDLLSGK
jgi:hypothetical protein